MSSEACFLLNFPFHISSACLQNLLIFSFSKGVFSAMILLLDLTLTVIASTTKRKVMLTVTLEFLIKLEH